MSSIEAQIAKLLGEDRLCLGKVTRATVRQLALQFAREPEPDGDVLAERAACLAEISNCRARLEIEADGDDACATEARRLGEAIHSIELGLHRVDKQGG